MAGEDPRYLDWIRKQHCVACLGPGPCHPHHSTNAGTESPVGPRNPKSVGGRRGKGQKAHDHFAIPLHHRCHRQFHDLTGQFEGWDKEHIRKWQDEMVQATRARYEQWFAIQPVSAGAPARASKPKRDDWTSGANAERARCAEKLREIAGDRNLTVEQAAALSDAASIFEARKAPYARRAT